MSASTQKKKEMSALIRKNIYHTNLAFKFFFSHNPQYSHLFPTPCIEKLTLGV